MAPIAAAAHVTASVSVIPRSQQTRRARGAQDSDHRVGVEELSPQFSSSFTSDLFS